jgi:hypothetical protein
VFLLARSGVQTKAPVQKTKRTPTTIYQKKTRLAVTEDKSVVWKSGEL